MQVVDSVIMLGSPGGHGMDTPRNLGGINQYLVVYVDDIDRHFQTAQRAGAEIVEEIADQFWGDRRYEALDLDGHRWAFHEHVRDVSPQEMAKAIAELSG